MSKIAGAVMILLASSLLGFLYSREVERKLNTLYEIQRILIMLKGEITYHKAPAAEAFCEVSKHVKEPFSNFFYNTAMELDQGFGKTIEQIWQECCDTELKELIIAGEDRKTFREFGACMGYLDAQMQISSIGLYSEKLDVRIKESERGIREKQKIFKCMGIMGGIFLILLIA